MFISGECRFIFVHVPKTGGSSVSQALRPYCDILNHESMRHAPLACALDYVSESDFISFLKICIVRNPWDWLVSNYLMVLRSPATPYYRRVVEMGFHEYVKFHIEEDVFPLKSYLFLPGRENRIAIDRIMRFENLEEEYLSLSEVLGIAGGLEHIQERCHDIHYSAFYDKRMREYVASRMKKEIDLLGYVFDRVYLYGEVDTKALVGDLVRAHAASYQGMAALSRQDWQGAVRLFGRAIDVKNDEPTFYLHMSHACAMLEQWDQSIKAINTAISLNPCSSVYREHQISVLARMNASGGP